MPLTPPAYIENAQVATNIIRYPWDEWKVNDYFLAVRTDQFERLDKLSDAANLALAIGCGEWICHRLSPVSEDSVPYHFLEAAWAAIVHPAYCLDRETNDNDWRGPVRGPLNMTISIVHDGIHRLNTDPHEAARACWMYNLATHILPHTSEFEKWLDACVVRLEQHHPRKENDDIWEEGPPFGIPVPRAALDPSVPYDPKNTPKLLNEFLQSLSPPLNPFLAEPDDVRDALGVSGAPYRYSTSDWHA